MLRIANSKIGPPTSTDLLSVLIPSQLVYLYFGDPARIGLRVMDLSPHPRRVIAVALRRLYRAWRPYSIPYVSLMGLCGALSGKRPPSFGEMALALTLGPMVWVSMLAFHDFAHRRADQLSGRDRPRAHWLLVPFGLVLLLAAFALGALAGRLTAGLVVVSAVFGVLYGVTKGLVLMSNGARGCVTSTGILSTGAIVGLTEQSVLVAFGLGLLDAAGNVLGDLRDREVDTMAGTRTIAVVSRRSGQYAWAVLFLAAVAVLAVQFPVVAPLAVVGASAAILSSTESAHLHFLLFKYSLVGVIALILNVSSVNSLVVFALLLLSIPAVTSYTAIHKNRIPRGNPTIDNAGRTTPPTVQ